MTTVSDVSSAKTLLLHLLGQRASEKLNQLLESKHLYQKVDLELATVLSSVALSARTEQLKFDEWLKNELPKFGFVMVQKQVKVVPRDPSLPQPRTLWLVLPHPSLYCKTCDRRETFTPVWYTDLTADLKSDIASGHSKAIVIPGGFQMLTLLYQCQRCLGTPESFLVRREGWSFSLHGRSPMERVEVPKYLPQTESRYYRDAVIAFETGKTLAALFYMRTFIEQFGRRITGLTGKATGDEIFDAYGKTLPSPIKETMPSLKDWYDKVSDALHMAREDATLFEAAKGEIERHFDIRRVHKIPEPKSNVEEKAPASAGAKPAAESR